MTDDINIEPDDEGPSTEDAVASLAAEKLKAMQPNVPTEPAPTAKAKKPYTNVDHPYGDGGHTETGHATLKKLGADQPYGGGS